MNDLVLLLDDTMSNKDTFIKTILLSRRIQHKIEQLKYLSEVSSPTETIVTFEDQLKVVEKPLPKLYNQSPFDSAIDISIESSLLNKPLPFIHKENKNLIHVKKKYNGVKGLLTRSYQIHDIVVSPRNYSLAYFLKLFICKDKFTGQDKFVLKVTLTTSKVNDLFVLPYFQFTFYHLNVITKAQKTKDSILLCNITDYDIQSALFIWLNYHHHQLPSIQLITHILREDLKIYIVYNK